MNVAPKLTLKVMPSQWKSNNILEKIRGKRQDFQTSYGDIKSKSRKFLKTKVQRGRLLME